MIISIVGKSGSGKSTITKKLVELNPKIRYLDIDKIGHYEMIFHKFKNSLLMPLEIV